MPSSGPTIAVAVPTSEPASGGAVPPASSATSPTPPSRSPSSTTVFEVINVLSSYTQNHERLKVLRVSLSVIRFLSILNFVYTILGLTFLLLALCRDWTPQFDEYQRNEFFRIGKKNPVPIIMLKEHVMHEIMPDFGRFFCSFRAFSFCFLSAQF